MPPTAAAAEHASDTDDDALAEVLDALIEDADAGRPVDLDAACARTPPPPRSCGNSSTPPACCGSSSPSPATPPPRTPPMSRARPSRPGRPGSSGDHRRTAGPAAGVRTAGGDRPRRDGRGLPGVPEEPGREVALKMIRQAALASPEDAARFRREAEATARLDDPHIVPVFEVGGFGTSRRPARMKTAPRHSFRMRLIEGTTLDAELRKGPRPPRELAATLAPVARAVDTAHRAGDPPPRLEAVEYSDRPDRPAVRDGLRPRRPRAEAAGRGDRRRRRDGRDHPTLTQPGAILGTPAWMSPEQAAGRRAAVGPHSDVYSIGAILYAGLTGRPPFQGETPAATVLRVLESEPRRPRRLNEDADPDLELIALKCLQKPADLRYPTAAALADDLEAYLAGDPVNARGGRFTDLIHRTFRETHHAPVLENWGLLWMWHAAVLVVLCGVTNSAAGLRRRRPGDVRSDVDGRSGRVGGGLLGRAAAGRADLVRGAADRARLGRQHGVQQSAVRDRVDPRTAPALPLPGPRSDRRRRLLRQGGDAVGRVIHPRRRPLRRQPRHGLDATRPARTLRLERPAVRRGDRRGVLLPGVEVPEVIFHDPKRQRRTGRDFLSRVGGSLEESG